MISFVRSWPGSARPWGTLPRLGPITTRRNGDGLSWRIVSNSGSILRPGCLLKLRNALLVSKPFIAWRHYQHGKPFHRFSVARCRSPPNIVELAHRFN